MKLISNENCLLQEEIKEVGIQTIEINPFQPRRSFAEEEIHELALSIASVGLIHPPVVRPKGDGKAFELISGERRWRAMQLLGKETITVIVRSTTHVLSAQAALIENIQRVDLNPIEVAKALKNLIEEFGFNQQTLAEQIGKKRSTVSNYLRLLTLSPKIQESVNSNKISMGHAKAILSLEGGEKQALLHELILRDDLSVREAEEGALRIAEKAKKEKLTYQTRDFYLEQIAEQLQVKLGTKVTIQAKGKKGRIFIDYYNFDDLDRLLAILTPSQE